MKHAFEIADALFENRQEARLTRAQIAAHNGLREAIDATPSEYLADWLRVILSDSRHDDDAIARAANMIGRVPHERARK